MKKLWLLLVIFAIQCAPVQTVGEEENQLLHGPMLGHVDTSSARVWVRAKGEARAGLLIGTDDQLDGARSVRGPMLNESSKYMGTLRAGNLKPDTRYYYAVTLDGKKVTSRPYPSFVTPVPEGQSTHIRVAFSSCSGSSGKASAPAWAELTARSEQDVILQLGDNHYANTTAPGPQRKAYFSQRNVPGFRAATRDTPTYGIWDDHDYGPNNSDRTAKGKQRSLQTFKQHWANPSYGTPKLPGIFTTFQRGDIEFILLDDRYYRDPNRSPDTEDKTLFGKQQLRWLKERLQTSGAKIKLVAMGSEWQLNGHVDSFSSFSHEQKAFLDFLKQEQMSGVILISGDRHFTGAYQIRGEVIEVTAGPMGSKNFPTKNLPDMFVNHGSGKMFAVLDLDTRKEPPKVVLEVHRAGDGIIESRRLTWDEINGEKKIQPLPLGK